LEKAQISRHVIARVKQHDIARNQFDRWHPLFASVAAHGCFGDNHFR
jgi:hypothetical protein